MSQAYSPPYNTVAIGGGDNGNISATSHLKGFNGMPFTDTLGWEMMRGGSVVGVSVTLNVSLETTPGTIDIHIRIAGSNSTLKATITTSGTGDYKAYATQAEGVDTFTADQVLVPYVVFNTFVGTINDVQALGELALI